MSPFLSTLGGGSARGFGRAFRLAAGIPGIAPDINTLRNTFYGNGSFTVPAGYAGFYVTAMGAGGGGSYRTGGGGGAYIQKALITAPAGTVFSVFVGSGGRADAPMYNTQYATATENICVDAYGDTYPCSGPYCCVIDPHPSDPNLYHTGDCNCFQNTYQYVTGYALNTNAYDSADGGQSGVSRAGQAALAGGGQSGDNGGLGGVVTLTGVSTYTAIFNGSSGTTPGCGYYSEGSAAASVNGVAGGQPGYSSGVCAGGGGGACGGGGSGGTGATPGNGNEYPGSGGAFPGGGGGGGGTCNANWCNPTGGAGAAGQVLIYY